MRILVTGAAGFIGARIVAALGETKHDVVELDLRTGTDVRDGGALDDLLRGVDVVCHQAAMVGAGLGAHDAPEFASHNDFGTATLLAAMARAGCHRLVLASSMVVYGEGRYRDVEELPPRRIADLDAGRFDHLGIDGAPLQWELVAEDAPLRPRSLYAASKVAQEHYAFAWALATGGAVTALRYHNVYGPHMPRDTPYSGVAAIFRSALEAGRAPQVFEDGRQLRDFVHLDDVAAANVAAIEADLAGFVAANVCSGHPITIGEVAAVLAAARGGPAPAITGRYRPGDVRHVVADPARARALLGFTASTTPQNGLREFAFAPLAPPPGSTGQRTHLARPLGHG